MPLKVCFQYAEMCLLHNILTEDRAGGRRGANDSSVLGLGLCLLFPLKFLNWGNLQTFSSLLLIFLPGESVINFLFFPFLIIVRTRSLDHFSLVSQNLVSLAVSWLSLEHDEFSTWMSDVQLVKIFPLWEINMGRHRFWDSHWHVVQSWDLREVGQIRDEFTCICNLRHLEQD